MKARSFVLFVTTLFLFAGCYDDTQLKTDIADLQQRVSAIESWCATANGQISALQSLVQALESKDYVTGVTPLADGSGYTITFTKSKAITIKHGEKGDTGDKGDKGDKGEDAIAPIIGVALDSDGNYYWTVKIGDGDPTWMVDKDGNKIRTTGDKGEDGVSPKVRIDEATNMWEISVDGGESWVSTGIAATGATGAPGVTPQIRINAESNIWEISMDGGSTWVSTGIAATGATGNDGKDGSSPVISIALYTDGNYYWQVNGEWMKVYNNMIPVIGPKGDRGAKGAQGDAVFAANGVNNNNSDYVEFTLANGNKIQFPKYKALKIGKDTGNDAIIITAEADTIAIKMPSGFLESDYSYIKAKMITSTTTDSDIKTKAAVEPAWEVTVNKPTFINRLCQDDATVIIKPIVGQLTVGDNSMLEVTIVGAEGINTTASRVITAGQIATADASTHTVSLITKGTPLTAELLTDALAGGNNLIINGLLSGECTNVNAGLITGDWLTLRDFIQGSESDINLTINHIIDVIPGAFNNCDKLINVNMPKATVIGYYAFYNCDNLTNVELPKATSIGGDAFYSCSNLTTIDLPKATVIGYYAFYNCDNLTNVELPNATYFLNYAFATCNNLNTINLPKAIYIDNNAFYNCANLTTIDLPEATSIGNNAFMDCDKLTTIDLPKATSIGWTAFSGCSKLTTIDLPEATSIGNNAFIDCDNLTTIELPKATDIGEGAFQECSNLTTIDLPKATSIGWTAFYGCSKLTTIALPKATFIGNRAFSDCDNLTTIELPEATDIGEGAFQECSNLTTIELPKVTSIANDAFSGCSLTTLKLAKTENVSFNTTVFDSFDTTKCDLYLGTAAKPASGNSWNGKTWKSISEYK